jgi:hypothetical protein
MTIDDRQVTGVATRRLERVLATYDATGLFASAAAVTTRRRSANDLTSHTNPARSGLRGRLSAGFVCEVSSMYPVEARKWRVWCPGRCAWWRSR